MYQNFYTLIEQKGASLVFDEINKSGLICFWQIKNKNENLNVSSDFQKVACQKHVCLFVFSLNCF